MNWPALGTVPWRSFLPTPVRTTIQDPSSQTAAGKTDSRGRLPICKTAPEPSGTPTEAWPGPSLGSRGWLQVPCPSTIPRGVASGSIYAVRAAQVSASRQQARGSPAERMRGRRPRSWRQSGRGPSLGKRGGYGEHAHAHSVWLSSDRPREDQGIRCLEPSPQRPFDPVPLSPGSPQASSGRYRHTGHVPGQQGRTLQGGALGRASSLKPPRGPTCVQA